MTLATTTFDAAKYLATPEAIADHLSEALETGDVSYIAHALGTAAKARGMTQLARESGVPRPTLYKALSGSGRPELSTILKVLSALGVQLQATPIAGSMSADEVEAPPRPPRVLTRAP